MEFFITSQDIANAMLGLTLIYATITDIRNRVIPSEAFVAVAILSTIFFYPTIDKSEIWNRVGIMIGLFLIYGSQALFFHGGGGDIVMMGVIGFCIGIRGSIITVFVSSISCVAYTLIRYLYRKGKKLETKGVWKEQVPYAPFATTGYIVYLIAHYTTKIIK